MNRNASAYAVIVIAVLGLLYLSAQLTRFDVGLQDHPHVISLRP